MYFGAAPTRKSRLHIHVQGKASQAALARGRIACSCKRRILRPVMLRAARRSPLACVVHAGDTPVSVRLAWKSNAAFEADTFDSPDECFLTHSFVYFTASQPSRALCHSSFPTLPSVCASATMSSPVAREANPADARDCPVGVGAENDTLSFETDTGIGELAAAPSAPKTTLLSTRRRQLAPPPIQVPDVSCLKALAIPPVPTSPDAPHFPHRSLVFQLSSLRHLPATTTPGQPCKHTKATTSAQCKISSRRSPWRIIVRSILTSALSFAAICSVRLSDMSDWSCWFCAPWKMSRVRPDVAIDSPCYRFGYLVHSRSWSTPPGL